MWTPPKMLFEIFNFVFKKTQKIIFIHVPCFFLVKFFKVIFCGDEVTKEFPLMHFTYILFT